MRIQLTFLLAALLIAAPVAAESGPQWQIVHIDAPEPFRGEAVTRVEHGLIQQEIAPGIVLSAGAGAEFSIEPPSAAASRLLHVGAGPIIMADLMQNSVRPLSPGDYRLQPRSADAENVVSSVPEYPLAPAHFYRQDYLFGDYVMVHQHEYLNSIGISVLPINQSIANLLTGFFHFTP